MLMGWKPTEFGSFTFVYGAIRSTPATSFNPGPFRDQSYLWKWPWATCGQKRLITLFAIGCPWTSTWFIFIAHARLYHSQISLSFSALSILLMENGGLWLSNFPIEHEAGIETGGTGCLWSAMMSPQTLWAACWWGAKDWSRGKWALVPLPQ